MRIQMIDFDFDHNSNHIFAIAATVIDKKIDKFERFLGVVDPENAKNEWGRKYDLYRYEGMTKFSSHAKLKEAYSRFWNAHGQFSMTFTDFHDNGKERYKQIVSSFLFKYSFIHNAQTFFIGAGYHPDINFLPTFTKLQNINQNKLADQNLLSTETMVKIMQDNNIHFINTLQTICPCCGELKRGVVHHPHPLNTGGTADDTVYCCGECYTIGNYDW